MPLTFNFIVSSSTGICRRYFIIQDSKLSSLHPSVLKSKLFIRQWLVSVQFYGKIIVLAVVLILLFSNLFVIYYKTSLSFCSRQEQNQKYFSNLQFPNKVLTYPWIIFVSLACRLSSFVSSDMCVGHVIMQAINK